MRIRHDWRPFYLLVLGLLVAGCPGSAPETTQARKVTEIPEDFRPSDEAILAGSVDYIDAKNGFRDLKFGTGVTADMKHADEQDAEQTVSYVREGEDLQIGAATAKEIRYAFFRDGLTSVLIDTADRENSRALLDVLWAAFGENVGYQAPVQVWNGNENVVYFSMEPSGAGRVRIWNRNMVDRAIRSAKARKKKTGK